MAALCAASEEVAPRAAVMTAAATAVSLLPEDEGSAEAVMRAVLAPRYTTVRPFLSLPRNRDAYAVCALEQLHRALNNRDVFASPSHR
ncbi:murein tripeptide amidase MpaA [Streptomyces zagrosensis]|uniref:Murein tripeptide amidase MpaA n=1 Tax=Streptomyces zagrosensis TaxID=1042984 RepID=A0A7W9Q6V4_9ACTN|nr:hypothetical protein [Streptomyces zagrosensis]MBB5934706.1 murein tripeptide amidase MpaA [Streptomyces zagrosensis]